MVGLVISQLGETFSCKRMDFFPAPIFTAMVTFADPQAIEHCVCILLAIKHLGVMPF